MDANSREVAEYLEGLYNKNIKKAVFKAHLSHRYSDVADYWAISDGYRNASFYDIGHKSWIVTGWMIPGENVLTLFDEQETIETIKKAYSWT